MAKPDEPRGVGAVEAGQKVAVITLGCARNEVDSEELAATLDQRGWSLVAEPDQADVVLVNTCGFVEQAKRDSIDTILAAADIGVPVVAAGCLAERYGDGLAKELPEAMVVGFDEYPRIADRLDDALAGRTHSTHQPRDRRSLLPLTPLDRSDEGVPGHSALGRRLLAPGPSASVKLASGCDRRCTFCAIPAFRGAFVSRRPTEVRDEIVALASGGVREVVLVSENSTSYGKDLGDLRLLEALLPELGSTAGLEWVRVSYLQPAEMRPGLVEVIADTPGVARYFDLSFQHASATVLRRMRRFGDAEAFLDLIDRIRAVAPDAGIRSNFIVGFPGETEDDLDTLSEFLSSAGLDAVGVFGYSDEDGTEAVRLDGHLPDDEVAARRNYLHDLADALMDARAAERIGQKTRLLVESVGPDGSEGRCEHQGPEDGSTAVPDRHLQVGHVYDVVIDDSLGVDLVARLAE